LCVYIFFLLQNGEKYTFRHINQSFLQDIFSSDLRLCTHISDEESAALLEAASADVRAVLSARLGPVPPLAFIKDIHYDPTSVLETLMARADIPPDDTETKTNNEEDIDNLLADLTLEEDAGELRRGAILKVIETAAVKSLAEHRRKGDDDERERAREDAERRDEFTQVRFKTIS
jgi:hypothetical protein